MEDCLFCKIANGDIGELIYDNEYVAAFRDINPQAPTHILVIPKKHISTLNDLQPEEAEIVGQMYLAAKEIAASEGIDADGYRTNINCNADGGQTVFHIHLHLLGGRRMGWPPWPGS